MSLAPRVVLVHRQTEYDQLLARRGTRGQAAFFLAGRGQSLDEVAARHAAVTRALDAVSAALPTDWRRGRVERADLPRFAFDPGDVVVVVGQDGLVANTAKYLRGQYVIGIDPEPGRNPGVLVGHSPERAGALLRLAVSTAAPRHVEARTMVQAVADDGQRLLALNEVFVGHPSHQTARYRLGAAEHQASSGILVTTGTGATGWARSVWLERRSTLALPAPTEPDLAWFVREAWPSPATSTEHTEGRGGLVLTVESDRLVAFGDGMESDALALAWGQQVRCGIAPERLSLLR